MTTMEYVRHNSVLVVVHGTSPPTAEEWTRYIEDFVAERPLIACIYVHTDGGGPSSSQRRELAEAMGDAPPRTAVLTDSMVARGIVTAMSWLKGSFIRTFPQGDYEGALRYLEIDAAARMEILGFVHASRMRLGPPAQSSRPQPLE